MSKLKELGLKTIILDLNNPILGTFSAKEGEVGSRGLKIIVMKNGERFDSTGLSLTFYGRTEADQVYQRLATEVSLPRGEYEMLYPSNMLMAGEVQAEIKIRDENDNNISTRTFTITVDEQIMSEDLLEGVDELDLLGKLLSAAANEDQRLLNESDRQLSEIARESNEDDRVVNELLRQENEILRVNNEDDRETNESLRISQYDLINEKLTNDEFKGDKGEQGIQGEQGEQGIQGIQGEQGIQGPKGDPGQDGKDGEQGDKGEQGIQGIQGEQGIQGDKGDPGEDGKDGIQGEQGDPGQDGKDGIQGDKGDPGADGEQGDKGDPGADGKDGEQGPKGDPGIQGQQGQPGEPGEQGLSAYQIWLNEGNTGTEQGFLKSLEGLQGEPGEQGDKGNPGPEGPPGKDGADGEPGLKGDPGEQGPQGPEGQPGPQGDGADIELPNKGSISDVSYTEYVTNEHLRQINVSQDSRAWKNMSQVNASEWSDAGGTNSQVNASQNSAAMGNKSQVNASEGSDAGGTNSQVNASMESIIRGNTSQVNASRSVLNNTNYSSAWGYGTREPLTQNIKIHLLSQSGSINHSGALNSGHNFTDFAELFPNLTGEAQGYGLIQTIDGHGVRPANEGEQVVGVTSAIAGVVLGETPFSWKDRWLKDEWGASIMEDVIDEDWEPNEDQTEEYRPVHRLPKENPDYDPEREHAKRQDRPDEWTVVGLVGQVYVRLNENVEPMDYVKPDKNGVGQRSTEPTNIRVMKITQAFDKDKGYKIGFCLLK